MSVPSPHVYCVCTCHTCTRVQARYTRLLEELHDHIQNVATRNTQTLGLQSPRFLCKYVLYCYYNHIIVELGSPFDIAQDRISKQQVTPEFLIWHEKYTKMILYSTQLIHQLMVEYYSKIYHRCLPRQINVYLTQRFDCIQDAFITIDTELKRLCPPVINKADDLDFI